MRMKVLTSQIFPRRKDVWMSQLANITTVWCGHQKHNILVLNYIHGSGWQMAFALSWYDQFQYVQYPQESETWILVLPKTLNLFPLEIPPS